MQNKLEADSRNDRSNSIFDQNGTQVETIQVDEARLGGTVRLPLLKQALVMYHANLRQGTVQTAGTRRSRGFHSQDLPPEGHRQRPHGNHPPARSQGRRPCQAEAAQGLAAWRCRRRRARLARNSAILSKIQSNDIRVVTEIKLPEPKTKHMVKVYKALGIDRSCLFALAERDEVLVSGRRAISTARR